MKFITTKTVFDQLKKDLIGKDAYRGVTLTYSWLANQFGHFSLGFIPSIIIYNFIKNKPGIHHPELWAALGVWSFWILFELYNFLGPLLLKTPSKRKELNTNYTFTPAWANVAFDTVTDLLYFGTGALFASLISHYNPSIVLTLFGMVLLLTYPAYYWYTTKMYIQYAEYPFQLRLSQWRQQIGEENKKAVLQFLQNKDQGKHLLVFGSRGSGKTTLAVGIATEASIKSGCCSYVTAVKLLSLFYDKEDLPIQDLNKLWTWKNSSLLVIDDINPGKPVMEDILSTKLFYEILNNVDCGPNNIKHIKEKNIIWVMGTEDPTALLEEKWHSLLEQIGIAPSNITSVNLDI